MTYRVTKTYGAELGLSACFRQPLATSHCRFLHGYALGFKFVFESDQLDENNWVTDFGGLKLLKAWLCSTFDHKLLVAQDDPAVTYIKLLGASMDGVLGPIADPLVVPAVGCESFARMAWDKAHDLVTALQPTLSPNRRPARVRLVEVECREHAGNAASYMGEGR